MRGLGGFAHRLGGRLHRFGDPAVAQMHRAVADGRHILDVVGDDDERQPRIPQPGQQIHDVGAALRIQPGQWLVQHHHLR